MVTIHGEPENAVETGYELKAFKDVLNELQVDFEDAKEAVFKEVHARALFSLEQSKEEIPMYPTFAGDAGQDFVKFKERTECRLKRNQVAEQNQLEKLRETLKARACRLIPETTEDIDAAWEILKDAFGYATRVLQQRLDFLGNMGDLPAGNNKDMPNVAKQAEFLLELGNVVEDVSQWNLESFLWLKDLGHESTSKKGQAKEESEESESTCSPLTLPGVQLSKPGEINTTPRHRV